MPTPRDPIDELSGPAARDVLRKIREILWPEDDPAADWSPDHLDLIARLFLTLRFPTVVCDECGQQAHQHRVVRLEGRTLGPCCWNPPAARRPKRR